MDSGTSFRLMVYDTKSKHPASHNVIAMKPQSKEDFVKVASGINPLTHMQVMMKVIVVVVKS